MEQTDIFSLGVKIMKDKKDLAVAIKQLVNNNNNKIMNNVNMNEGMSAPTAYIG